MTIDEKLNKAWTAWNNCDEYDQSAKLLAACKAYEASKTHQPDESPKRQIAVGKYVLRDHKLKVGCITIMHESGEGGTFDEAELEKVIEEFYAKHF